MKTSKQDYGEGIFFHFLEDLKTCGKNDYGSETKYGCKTISRYSSLYTTIRRWNMEHDIVKRLEATHHRCQRWIPRIIKMERQNTKRGDQIEKRLGNTWWSLSEKDQTAVHAGIDYTDWITISSHNKHVVRPGNAFGRVCLFVCLSLCLFVISKVHFWYAGIHLQNSQVKL